MGLGIGYVFSEGGRWREFFRGESVVKVEGLVVEIVEVVGGVYLGLVSIDLGLFYGGLIGGEVVFRCRGAWGFSFFISYSFFRFWVGSVVSIEFYVCFVGSLVGFLVLCRAVWCWFGIVGGSVLLLVFVGDMRLLF